jgi:O-antigen/teichoic acid export membrane protein
MHSYDFLSISFLKRGQINPVSLKKNIIANYVSQFSMILIGLLMMPMYIKYMGTEAYGLVGLYMMLQAWMQLLDMGMTPTLIRETARFRGGNISRTELKQLFRTLETIFLCIASSAALAAFLFSGLVAASWLKVEHIPLNTVQLSLLLIALAVTLRWVSSLYRGIITGFEWLVWLSTYNICIAVAFNRSGFTQDIQNPLICNWIEIGCAGFTG